MKRILLILFTIGLYPMSFYGQDGLTPCTAYPIAAGDSPINVSTIDGDAPSPVCPDNTNSAANGIWYSYTAPGDYSVTINSDLAQNQGANPLKDTRVHVYSGVCGALQCIAGNEDSGSEFLSTVSFSAEAGETYFIAWDDYWNVSDFDFELTETTTSLISFTQESISAPGSDRGAVDMNGDFLDDLVAISSSNININYQQPDGSFVSANYSSGGTYSAGWSMAAGDYDRNGYNDLVYGNTSGAHVVKANDTGDGYSVAETSHSVFTQRTNFADFNNDGNLDVFICDDIEANEYFINDGTNLTLWEGDDPGTEENPNPIPGGLGLITGNYGSVWVDYDNDGDSDLFIAKCGSGPINQLIRNDMDTPGELKFVEVSESANMDDDIQTWSSAWGDYDGDGDMDCYVGTSASYQTGKLMRNDDGVFTDITASAGLDSFSGYGHENQPFDFNNDGYIDIFSNGSILFNNGNGTFTPYSAGVPQEGPVGDMNNDGFLDVFLSGKIYKNDGNSNNWLKVCLIGTTSNINGIGARVEVSSPSFNNSSSTKAQIRDVRSAQGFAYMSTLNTHFGIGSDSSINSVTVYWPSGTIDYILNPTINSTLLITEGETLSLESTLTDDMILFPNPTKDVLNLNADYGFENAIYAVFDITGKRILNERFNSNKIDVSALSTGHYILRIINNGIIRTQKFIKH